MPDDAELELQLKKRARRRLIGSVALAGLVAVVLPLIMDNEPPPQPARNVRIRIPGENTPFRPAPPPVSIPLPAPASPPARTEPDRAPTQRRENLSAMTSATSVTSAPPASAARPAETPPARSRPPEKPAEKPTPAQLAERKRAEDILSGRFTEPPSVAPAKVFVILIGTFSNPASIKNLQTKFGQVGVKTFTEDFDSPGGKQTRLRAGPFPTEPAARQALEKIQRIGVSGIIASRSQ